MLSALALAMGGREPLPEALERLAQADPALVPWAARLAPPLRAGQALPALLRRWRLVDRDEADDLDRAADPAAGLRGLADGTGRAPVLYLLVRWYPAWLMTAFAVCALLVSLTLAPVFEQIYRELGIKLPAITVFVLGAGAEQFLVAGAAWAACWLVALIPGVRHLLHLNSPEVHHAAAWWRLVRAARHGRLGGDDRPWWRPSSPARDWKTWWLVSRWRCSAERREALAGRTLEDRLADLGLPGRDAPSASWDQVEADALRRFRASVHGAWVVMGWQVLLLAALAAVAFALVLPFVSIIEQLNSFGGGWGGGSDGAGWVRALMSWLAWLPADWQVPVRDALEWFDDRLASIRTPDLPVSAWLLVVPLAPLALEWSWVVMRFLWPELAPRPRHVIGAALARTVRERGDVATVLRDLASHLPLRWAWRVRAATGLMSGDAPLNLPWGLRRAGILPGSLIPSGEAALVAGPAALADWCAGWAEDDGTAAALGRMAASLFWPTVLVGALTWFLLVMVVPKFQVIFHELGMPMPALMGWIEQAGELVGEWWLLLMLSGTGLLVAVVRLAMASRWRRRQRLVCGRYIVRAAAGGAAETAIGRALGGRHREAGEAGDFAALCRASGWHAGSPAVL
ncbi:MAG: hypothetical protein L6R48_05605, partial [Planctomycetes bacterium]|nr:hypothetical protein [Planctomycetota bacterium]